MANVEVNFSGVLALRQQLESLNNKQEKEACMKECADTLAQVYLAEAIKNTPVGGAKEFAVTPKAYQKINATEVGPAYFKEAKGRNGRTTKAVKRIKRTRKKQKRYLVMTASEHMRRSWGADEVKQTGHEYAVKVYNSASYASYVNDGHRQQPGRFVPAIGKRLVKSWVDGKFMAEAAEKKTKRQSKRLLSQIIVQYLTRRMG